MHRSVVLRVGALLCLAAVFHDSAVSAQQTATCPEPVTVKDVLDLLGKLEHSNGLKEKVSKEVEDKVQNYLKTTEISEKSVKQNLDELFKKVKELRERLLKTTTDYGKYANVTDADIGTSATVLTNWLPVLHSEMWFLYFQTATECKRLGGGWWTVQDLKGATDKAQLTKWLTSKDKGFPLIPKGFSENELKEGRDPDIAAKTGIKLHKGEPLNHAQYGLLFLGSKWHHSNLASAVLFLQEFCSEVKKDGGMFKERLADDKYKGLKSACENLPPHLKSLFEHLWPLYSPLSEEQDDGGDDAGKTTTEQHKDAHNKIYEGKLKSESFDKYTDWLKKYIVSINDSLKEMAKSSWNIDELSNATMAGPFKFGFVFKDVWDETALYRKLNSVTTTLSADLSSIATALGCPIPQPVTTNLSENQTGKSTNEQKPTVKPEGDAKDKGKSPAKQSEGALKPGVSEDPAPAKPKKSPVAPKSSDSGVSKDSSANPKEPEEAQLRGEQVSQPSSFMAPSLLSCMLTCVIISVF